MLCRISYLYQVSEISKHRAQVQYKEQVAIALAQSDNRKFKECNTIIRTLQSVSYSRRSRPLVRILLPVVYFDFFFTDNLREKSHMFFLQAMLRNNATGSAYYYTSTCSVRTSKILCFRLVGHIFHANVFVAKKYVASCTHTKNQ